MTDKTKEAPARSALKLALAVLKEWHKGFPDDWTDFDTEAVAAIHEALAEPSEALALVNEVDQEESSGTEQSAQQGWKLVPYDPSIDMQEHGSIASGYDLSQARAKRVYQAMIDMHDVMMEREPTDQYLRLEAGYPEQPAQPQTDQSVTPEYLEWLDSIQPRHGVGGNEAWNAGVAWAKAQPQQETVAKPYAYEYGRNNGDGTYSVVIEKGDLVQTEPAVYNYVRPRNAHKDWPIKELFDHPPAQQQEPVAWYCKEGLNQGVSLKQESPDWEPLYTTKFNFKPLTDEEADELVRRFARYELLRAIEATLREKNA